MYLCLHACVLLLIQHGVWSWGETIVHKKHDFNKSVDSVHCHLASVLDRARQWGCRTHSASGHFIQWSLSPLGSKYPTALPPAGLICDGQGSINTVMSFTSSRSHFPRSYSSQYSYYTCFYLCEFWVIVHEVGLGFAVEAELEKRILYGVRNEKQWKVQL